MVVCHLVGSLFSVSCNLVRVIVDTCVWDLCSVFLLWRLLVGNVFPVIGACSCGQMCVGFV